MILQVYSKAKEQDESLHCCVHFYVGKLPLSFQEFTKILSKNEATFSKDLKT